MAYASRAHLEQRFGMDEIAGLAEDEDNPGFDRTSRALGDATAIINSYLGVSFRLPLPNGSETRWALLREIACDLARAELYDDASLDRVKELNTRAIGRLEKLRDGELNLVDDDGRACSKDQHGRAARPGPGLLPRITGRVSDHVRCGNQGQRGVMPR